MSINQILWSHSKNLFEKMAKILKNPNFDLFVIIKNPLKIKRKKKKKKKNTMVIPQVLGLYCCAQSSQISERLDKNRGSMFDLKKNDGRTDDGQLGIR